MSVAPAPRSRQPESDAPTPSRPAPVPEATPAALRRALARARDGKTLDQAEAVVLLQARGDDLTGLLAHAGAGPRRRAWPPPGGPA